MAFHEQLEEYQIDPVTGIPSYDEKATAAKYDLEPAQKAKADADNAPSTLGSMLVGDIAGDLRPLIDPKTQVAPKTLVASESLAEMILDENLIAGKA